MSIIKDNILYHNVDYLKKTTLGDKLYRYPEELIDKLNHRARYMARYSCGCELRFVTESTDVDINLFIESESDFIHAKVYKGDYVHDIINLRPDQINRLHLSDPKFAEEDIFFENNDFDKNVWRIHLQNCECTVVSVDTWGYPLRAPTEDEMPKKKMLAYGSSITHGARAVTNANSYINEAGRILGIDVCSKGVGGSCHFEPEIADYFSKQNEWDYIWIEGAVNSTLFTVEEFEKRFNYFIDTLSKTNKKIFMTTVFPCRNLYNRNDPVSDKLLQFNEIIRAKKDKGIIIEGEDVLTDPRFLTTDYIHPSNEGHLRMGINLASILKKYL